MEMKIKYMPFKVLVWLSENKANTQSDIASGMNIAISTVSKAVYELIELGLITKKYSVSKQGKEFLEYRKVKRAIILAAGWGSRMHPVTANTPKPLVKVNGKPIVESIIEALEKRGINDITVVTGKLAYQFDYLKDRVNLVHNPVWNERNNISSVWQVKDKLENALIIEGDQLFYDHNAIDMHYIHPVIYGQYSEGKTLEDTFNLNGLSIIDVTRGGYDKFQWIGVIYFDKSMARKYVQRLEEVYDEPQYHDALFERVIWDLTRTGQAIVRMKEVVAGKFIELDSVQDLVKVDKSYEHVLKEII